MRQAQRLPILMYHSIDTTGSVVSTSPAEFAAHMRFLHASGARTLALRDAVGPRASERGVVITFDDGFASVYEHAFPALAHYGFTATVFLVTDYCGRTNAWPTQPRRITPRPLLQWRQVQEMSAAGISFGAHTRSHPDLTRLPRPAVEEEIRGSKRAIEEAIQQPVEAFAYPYGVYDDAVKSMVARQFTLACSTTLGFATAASDPFALERIDVYYVRRPYLFRTLFSPTGAAYVGLRRLGRACRGTSRIAEPAMVAP